MRHTQRLLLSSALALFITAPCWGSALSNVDDDGIVSSVNSSAKSGIVANFLLEDFPNDHEARAFLGYFWDTLSTAAQKMTQNFIEQPLNAIFGDPDEKLATQGDILYTRLSDFKVDLSALKPEDIVKKIKLGQAIKKLSQDQSDLLNNYYLKPLETGDVDEETDLTQSLRKTVSDTNVSPEKRAELDVRKQFALNNFRHLLEYGQNSIALDRDMFVKLIQEAMTTKSLLSKDIGSWKNFKLDDLAEPFTFQPVPLEAPGQPEDKGKVKAPVVYEMLPVILALENGVPTTPPLVSEEPKIDPSRPAPKTHLEIVEMTITADDQVIHTYEQGFVTYTPKKQKATRPSLFWRLLGYK